MGNGDFTDKVLGIGLIAGIAAVAYFIYKSVNKVSDISSNVASFDKGSLADTISPPVFLFNRAGDWLGSLKDSLGSSSVGSSWGKKEQKSYRSWYNDKLKIVPGAQRDVISVYGTGDLSNLQFPTGEKQSTTDWKSPNYIPKEGEFISQQQTGQSKFLNTVRKEMGVVQKKGTAFDRQIIANVKAAASRGDAVAISRARRMGI